MCLHVAGVAIGFRATYKEQKYMKGEYITENTLRKNIYAVHKWIDSELIISLRVQYTKILIYAEQSIKISKQKVSVTLV